MMVDDVTPHVTLMSLPPCKWNAHQTPTARYAFVVAPLLAAMCAVPTLEEVARGGPPQRPLHAPRCLHAGMAYSAHLGSFFGSADASFSSGILSARGTGRLRRQAE